MITRRRILTKINEEADGAFVDLGLPTGLKWATGNIVKDANGNYSMGNETDYGCYFSWSNIEGHNASEEYDFVTYSNVNNDIASNDASHDAALACLGSPWHLPTKDDFQELYNNTDREWTTIDGVNGWKFMNKDNHLVYVFLPATGQGYRSTIEDVGEQGNYWSSSWNADRKAYCMYFKSSSVHPQLAYWNERGFTVRAVRE